MIQKINSKTTTESTIEPSSEVSTEITNFKNLKAKEFKPKQKRKYGGDDDAEEQLPAQKKQDGLKQKRKYDDESEESPHSKKAATGDGDKPDWKKLKQEKKELKLKRKQSASGGNDVYELGVKAKKIWEEVRREDCKGARKEQLCKELYSLIKGKAKSLIHAHDTVRVIETLVSVGGDEYRTHLFNELKDDILEMSKNKYSRFFVLKLLRYGTKDQKDVIMKAMQGHVVGVMRHKVACDVLELAYNDFANAKQRAHMVQEFYGPRFKHFKEDVHTLDAVLKKYPDLKESILNDFNKALLPVLNKGVFTNSLIHTLLKEFMYVCGDSERSGIIEIIKENLLPIVHTKDGARVAMLCLWYSGNKDRKTILKSFKGHFIKIATEEHAFMVLLAAFDSVDDTKFVAKAVLSELMDGIDQLIKNDSGRKVLKYLVAPRNKLFFHPDVLAILQGGDASPHSKKDRPLKYKELQAAVAKPILNTMLDNVATWARDPQWTLFIASALQSLSDDSIIPVFQAIAEICAEAFIPGEDKHFLDISYMAKMISFIIQCDKDRYEKQTPLFTTQLIDIAEEEMRGWSLTNRGCFILVNIFETAIPDIVKRIMDICSPLRSKLPKMKFKGAEILLKKISA